MDQLVVSVPFPVMRCSVLASLLDWLRVYWIVPAHPLEHWAACAASGMAVDDSKDAIARAGKIRKALLQVSVPAASRGLRES